MINLSISLNCNLVFYTNINYSNTNKIFNFVNKTCINKAENNINPF